MVSARTLRLDTYCFAACLLLCGSSAQGLELTSSEIANGAMLTTAQVYSRCGGENRSPALAWSGAPKGTQSYALAMFDPDANNGRGFWHWLVLDIPANTQTLPSGAGSGRGLPQGAIQSENDFGEAGFGGVCPPPGSGTHHYVITLFALSAASLPLDGRVRATTLVGYLKAHALATATLTGIYRR